MSNKIKDYVLIYFRWHSSMKWSCSEKYTIDFKPWEEEQYD